MTRSLSARSRSKRPVCSLGFMVFAAFLMSCTSNAQDASESVDRERATADRYLQVLLRRPRPGVALDRVYGYHVQNDSLGELQKQLSDPNAPDGPERQMVWGLIQLQRGRSAEAANLLAEAEPRLVDDAACSFYLGRAYLAVGQTEQAAAAMERAVQRGPSRAEALPMFTLLGRIYSRAGEREKALAVWTRLEALFPGDTRVGGQIARTLAEEGNYEEAKNRYERLSKASKKDDEKIAFAVQAPENIPKEDDWNTLLMKRDGDTVAMVLNDKPLLKIPVQGHERPGVNRYEKRDLRVRSMRLTGDWPKEFPAELIAK